MMMESFPQFVMSLFIMQALQVREPMNILSCSASAISVLYGLGDFLAMWSSENRAEYPFSKTVWGTLSIFVDTLLRSFTLAYWMTISKAYVLIVPFAFCIIMGFVIFIKTQDFNVATFFLSFFNAIVSFGGSSFEDNPDYLKHFTFRPLSKGIFGAILMAFSIFFVISASPKIFHNSNMANNYTNFEPSQCSILCQGNKTDEEQEAFENYCNNLWENIEPDTFIHQSILIVIGVLFFLSMLEGILEHFFDWMPYKKLYEGSDDGFIRGGSRDEQNQQPELQEIPNSDPQAQENSNVDPGPQTSDTENA